MSEQLQELLLRYIQGEREFLISCKDKDRIRKLFLALGRQVEIKEINEKDCLIRVYSRAS